MFTGRETILEVTAASTPIDTECRRPPAHYREPVTSYRGEGVVRRNCDNINIDCNVHVIVVIISLKLHAAIVVVIVVSSLIVISNHYSSFTWQYHKHLYDAFCPCCIESIQTVLEGKLSER